MRRYPRFSPSEGGRVALSAPRPSERPKLGHDLPLLHSTEYRQKDLAPTARDLKLKHKTRVFTFCFALSRFSWCFAARSASSSWMCARCSCMFVSTFSFSMMRACAAFGGRGVVREGCVRSFLRKMAVGGFSLDFEAIPRRFGRRRSTRSEFTQIWTRDHPAPSLMDTSRMNEVKAPLHFKTPRCGRSPAAACA